MLYCPPGWESPTLTTSVVTQAPDSLFTVMKEPNLSCGLRREKVGEISFNTLSKMIYVTLSVTEPFPDSWTIPYHRNEYHFHKTLQHAKPFIHRDSLCIGEKAGKMPAHQVKWGELLL